MRGLIALCMVGLFACSGQARPEGIEAESESATETETEAATEAESESATETETGAEAEAAIEAESESATETGTGAEAEAEAAIGTVTETGVEGATEGGGKSGSKIGPGGEVTVARKAKAAVVPAPGADPAGVREVEVIAQPEVTPKPAPAVVAGPCGEKGEPMCPLQAWMEKHLQRPLEDGDAAKLASGLREAAGFAPEPGWNDGANGWSSLARKAAEVAASGDMQAAKQSCKGCHKAWRKKYKESHRKRPVP